MRWCGCSPGNRYRYRDGGSTGAGILSRNLRDRRALARYAGLTGSPDESGLKSREKGLAKAGNARVRRGLIQSAWRFLMFQKTVRWRGGIARGPRVRVARARRQ